MPGKGTGFKSVARSILASAFGVQSRKNQDRDFADGRPTHFIIAGIIGTVLFISVLILIVRLVLSSAG